jgi:hypothetical protein
MVCVMIGSFGYRLATASSSNSGTVAPATNRTPEALLAVAAAVAACAFAAMTLSAMKPAALISSGLLRALPCLLFEVCVGVYLNAAGALRARHVGDDAVRGPVLAATKAAVAIPAFALSSACVAAGSAWAALALCAVLCCVTARSAVLLSTASSESADDTGGAYNNDNDDDDA